MTFVYPKAKRVDQVDDYHGTAVADPYRWLEDPDDDATKAFIAAENELTFGYLHNLAERKRLRDRIAQLWDVPRTEAPQRRAATTVWAHNDGLANQPTFYVQDGDEPRVLLDPSALSDDGTVAVVVTSLSDDGRYFAYTTAEAGSDWQTLHIRDTATGGDLPEVLRFVKHTAIAWHQAGFFYSRFPEQDPASTEPSRNQSVWYHRLDTNQADDVAVWSNPENPDLSYSPETSGSYLVLIETDGTSHANGLLWRRIDGGELTRLFPTGLAMHTFVTAINDAFLLHTDRDAPNGKVVQIHPDTPEEFSDVVPEDDPIEMVAVAADRLVVTRLSEASHRVELYGLDGTPDGEIQLPGLGTVTEVSGHIDEPDLFIGFESFAHPPLVIAWSGGVTSPFGDAPSLIDPDQIVVERRYTTSSDGATVGMFVVRLADTPLPAPTELYGYGGFAINMTPMFMPARLAFLEEGGIVVVANLRGGIENGEHWHRQGMLGSKQQVFDDFIACAEQLIADGATTSDKLGIRGRSNGGLLTAATMLQRPDLFGAAIVQVPVTDMLRFQHFTAGRYWTVEYGDAADPDAFEWLIAYSPYHNVEPGVAYPPALITSAESDDRVVPMHAMKFAAALQHAAGGKSERPLLLRVDTRSGHGLGKPTDKLIDEMADIYGFLLHHLSA